MPVSQCTRCDQLIDYDASHEGEEVLCPACDNITRLRAIPVEDLPATPVDADSATPGKASRSPIRLAADELPPPAADAVAPVGAPEDVADPRGPEPAEPTPAPGPETAVVSDEQAAEHHGLEIRIVDGALSEGDEEFHFATDEGDRIRLRLPLDQPWLLGAIAAGLIVALFLSFRYVHRKVQESQPLTEADVQAILATQPRVGLANPDPPPRVPVTVPAGPMPEEEPAPMLVGQTRPKGGKDVVDVRFPTLPVRLARDEERARAEAFRFYIDMAFNEPFRLFGDTVLDLRTLRFAAGAGMVDFPEDWRLLGGVAQALNDDGLQLRLDRRFYPEAGVVLVTDFPKAFVVRRDQVLGLMLRRTGSRRVKLAEGEDRVVETYEFGMLPSEPMLKVAQIKAAERESAARREMEEITKRKAEEAATEEEKRQQARDASAVRSLRARAERGSAAAQYQLGLRYLEGRGVPENHGEGLRQLRAAAAQDYRSAKVKLKELGVEEDSRDSQK